MSGRAIVAGAALMLIASVSPVSSGQAPDPAEVRYVRPLEIPSRWERFAKPTAVTADLHTGEVFVADGKAHRLVIFDPAGLERYIIRGGAAYRGGADVAIDPEGRIIALVHVETRQTVIDLDFDGGDPRRIDIPPAAEGAQPRRVVSLCLSPDGTRIYLLDDANKELLLLDREGALSRTVDLLAGRAKTQATDLILTRVDAYGTTLLVPDPMDGQVLLLDLDGNPVGTIGVKGGTACTTGFPVAAALGQGGVVYVLDRQKALISAWDRRRNRCLGEIGGIGREPGRLYQPSDLALDGDGRLYTVQGLESRVQVFEPAAPAEGSASMKFRRFERESD